MITLSSFAVIYGFFIANPSFASSWLYEFADVMVIYFSLLVESNKSFAVEKTQNMAVFFKISTCRTVVQRTILVYIHICRRKALKNKVRNTGFVHYIHC